MDKALCWQEEYLMKATETLRRLRIWRTIGLRQKPCSWYSARFLSANSRVRLNSIYNSSQAEKYHQFILLKLLKQYFMLFILVGHNFYSVSCLRDSRHLTRISHSNKEHQNWIRVLNTNHLLKNKNCKEAQVREASRPIAFLSEVPLVETCKLGFQAVSRKPDWLDIFTQLVNSAALSRRKCMQICEFKEEQNTV